MKHPWPFWTAVLNLQPTRYPATLELLGVGLRLASAVSQRFKQALNCPRPVAWSPLVQPLIPTPAHAATPSGHSARSIFSCAPCSDCPARLTQPAGGTATSFGHRVADNREVAGLHFRVDTLAGRVIGEALGNWFVACASNRGQWRAGLLDASALPGTANGTVPDNPKDKPLEAREGTPWSYGDPVDARAIPLLHPLWTRARAEWAAEGFKA